MSAVGRRNQSIRTGLAPNPFRSNGGSQRSVARGGAALWGEDFSAIQGLDRMGRPVDRPGPTDRGQPDGFDDDIVYHGGPATGPIDRGGPRVPATDRGYPVAPTPERPPTPQDSFSWDAVTQEVNPNQLMATHMDALLSQDSPLMRRAAQQGIDFAASRGLGNSSIAAGNAMGSMIDRAMPIAQFDAGRYGSVADQNMAAQNQVGMFNTDLAQNQNQFNRTLDFNYDELSQRDQQFLADLGFRRDELSQRDRQFLAELGQRDDQFYADLDLRRDDLGQRNEQFYSDLDLRRDDLGQRNEQFYADLGFREDQLSQNDQQFLADLALRRDDLSQQDRQFLEDLDFRRDDLDQRDQQFLLDLAFRREDLQQRDDQFYADLDERGRQFDISENRLGRTLAAEVYSRQLNTIAPIISSIYNNPNISADDQRAIVDHLQNTIIPQMFSNAWQSIPDGLLSPEAMEAGATMPGMDDFPIGPQQPGDSNPDNPGPVDSFIHDGIEHTRPPGIADASWQAYINSFQNMTP